MSKIYLKSMKIEGFRAFSKLTEFSFSPNLNYIIGPDNIGKSSLLEAITWTLFDWTGEENSVENIVFHGNENLKPYTFAEVELCYGNEDEGNHIIIKRRIEINEKNEWFINNTRYDRHESFKPHFYDLKLPELCLLEDFEKDNRNRPCSWLLCEIEKELKNKQCFVEGVKKKLLRQILKKEIPLNLIGICPDDDGSLMTVIVKDDMNY